MTRPKTIRRKLETVLHTSLALRTSDSWSRRQIAIDPRVRARIRKLKVANRDLAWVCDPSRLQFRSTREVEPLRGMLGQRQAHRSLKLGLTVASPGYNLFLCGWTGAEALRAVESHIRSLRLPAHGVPDRVYVQSFEDPHRPRLLELPPGQGAQLRTDLGALLRRLHKALGKENEKKWKARARSIIEEELPSIQARFQETQVLDWLRAWKRTLLGSIHHASIEDFEVNLISSGHERGAPVVVERNPNASNLFGWIGRRALGDQAPAPHFTEIRGGSFLQADGGVLLLNAADFYSVPASWNLLKTCLKYGSLQIEDTDPSSPARVGGLKPQPIGVQVKVVLLGDFELYDELFETDPDFREIFKVRVDFDSEISLTPRVERVEYPAFIAKACAENHLLPLTPAAVAKVLELAMRKAGRKGKVTIHGWLVVDLIREADYWARLAGRRLVTDADVERAELESVRRLNLVETKIAEMIAEGTILITTSGARVGQVNGLAIYDTGDYLFGKPSRITAETAYGQGGIINIERESGFSGRSHDKGVQILAGYLRSRFAQRRPLNLTASVCFEQSYSGIDGDSASAAEIYAILSSLSGLPLRQDIAVTGSMNQKGDIQPIGGVNEKIEGFYDCVRAGRMTGKEGVIIPRKNLNELMLRDDVVRAVKRGEFHIYAISKVEEGFEILTGAPTGNRRKDGSYTPGSSFALVDDRLEDIANGLRHYQASDEEGGTS